MKTDDVNFEEILNDKNMQCSEEMRHIVEKLKDGTCKFLNNNDKFTFSCKICGECCRNRNDIIINPYDVFRMSKLLNMKAEYFMTKYVDCYLGSESKFPMTTIKFKEVDTGVRKYTVCPFLKKKDDLFKCTVHECKPLVCAIYPLGRFTVFKDAKCDKIKYFSQPVSCNAGHETEFTLNEWLKMFDIETAEKSSTIYHNFIAECYTRLDFQKLHESKLSDRTKDMFYNAFFSTLYTDFDDTKNVITMLNEKYDKALQLIDLIIVSSKLAGINVNSQSYKVPDEKVNEIMSKIKKNKR